MKNTCENIECVNGYIQCECCNGTNLDDNDEICDYCFDGSVECECNPDNIKNK